ncbi:MAG: UTP--glucose-1-phosphate uridylyltransferase [bacterium]
MRIKKAVIPAAGLGTRLLPATKSQPKEMLPVGRKPTIQYVVEEVEAAGLKQVLIITGQKKRAIEDHFDRDQELVRHLENKRSLLDGLKHEEMDIRLFYTRQSVQAGLAHAIGLAEDFVGDDPFVVLLGDSIISSPEPGSLLQRLMDAHISNGATATIALEEVEWDEVVRYGIAKPKGEVGEEFEIEDLIEKPDVKDAPSNLAIAARYVFEPEVMEAIKRTPPGKGGEMWITDTIRIMLKEGARVFGVKLGPNETRYDIGNFQSYFRAFFDFCISDSELGEDFRRYALERLSAEGKR